MNAFAVLLLGNDAIASSNAGEPIESIHMVPVDQTRWIL